MGYISSSSRQTGPYRVPMAGYVHSSSRQTGPYRVPMAGPGTVQFGDTTIVPTAATAPGCAAVAPASWVAGMTCQLPDGNAATYNGTTFTAADGSPLTATQLAAIQQPSVLDKLSSSTGMSSTVLIAGAAAAALYFLTRK